MAVKTLLDKSKMIRMKGKKTDGKFLQLGGRRQCCGEPARSLSATDPAGDGVCFSRAVFLGGREYQRSYTT